MILFAIVTLFAFCLVASHCETLNDGKIVDINFSETLRSVSFEYKSIDKLATITFVVYPAENNTGEVNTTLCLDSRCSMIYHTFRGFMSFDIPSYTADETTPIDFTDRSLYIVVEGSSSTKAHVVIMSSIILKDEKTVEFQPRTIDDGYDYRANNYYRYFRIFVCDDDDSPDAPGKISFGNTLGYATVYFNAWNSTGKQAPGRPTVSGFDRKTSGSYYNIYTMPGIVIPGWVFIGVDFSEIINHTLEEGETEDSMAFSITPQLEMPVEYVTKDKAYETALCFYEDCYELAIFQTADYLKDVDGSDLDVDRLTFLVMLNDRYIHTNEGMIVLEAMTNSFWEAGIDLAKSGTDNLLEFTRSDIAFLRDQNIEELYIAVTATNSYDFPMPIPSGSSLSMLTTILRDAEVVRVGRRPLSMQLKTKNDWNGMTPVYHARMILNTVGVNKPYYITGSTALLEEKPVILCDYLVVVSAHDDEPPQGTDLLSGVYTGSGYAPAPYYDLNETGEVSNYNYLITSRSINQNLSEGIPKDIKVISINNSSNYYFQDGAYILDVIDFNYDLNAPTETGIMVDIGSQPSWILEPNTQYGKYLNGSTDFDYFTFKTSNISHGVTIHVELINAALSTSGVGIYASFINRLPTETSKYVVDDNYYASLNLSAEQITRYADTSVSGVYTIYIAVNTVHKGEMTIIATEGVDRVHHIGNASYADVELEVEGHMELVMFHSSKTAFLPNLIITLEGLTETWDDEVVVLACVDTVVKSDITSCESGYFVGLSSASTKGVIQIAVPTVGTQVQPDYYIHILAKGLTEAAHPNIMLRVFGEDCAELSKEDSLYLKTSYDMEPILVHFSTVLLMDYTLMLSIPEVINGVRLKVRVCANYPSISVNDPPTIDPLTNIRNCQQYTLTSNNDLLIDLVGDMIINDGTQTNDAIFISSPNKYMTIYPEKSAINTPILIRLYEDTHVRANKSEMLLYGEFSEMTYFRLHIVSTDSVNVNDVLNYEFTGPNPIYYCLGNTPHASIESGNCINGSTAYDPEAQTYRIVHNVKLMELNPMYDAKSDIYAYFTIYFPEGLEGNGETLSTYFSNTVVHNLNLIRSPTDNINFHTYFFELVADRTIGFYTNDIKLGSPFRFILIPDVNDIEQEYSGTYSQSQVAVAHTTDYLSGLPKPDIMNSDTMTAGILVVDYTITEASELDGKPFFALSVRYLNEMSSYGLYRAGFVDLSTDMGSSLADITFLKPAQLYSFYYDGTNPLQETGTPKSKLFYYPYAETEMAVKVYPCAGVPGVYSSYISPFPTMEDREYSLSFPQLGHEAGTPFTLKFFDLMTYDDITVPTGFMFNATYEGIYYITELDPEHNIRWDAEMRLVTGSGVSAYGGPLITNSDVKIRSKRSAEITVEFAEAVSGFSMDPTVMSTYIEYALYAIPAPSVGFENPRYDASPMTHCGLLNYGFPLSVDSEGNAKWIRGTIDTNADGSNPDASSVVAILKITSNNNPSTHVYPENMRINQYTAMTNEDAKRFNVNIVAREVRTDTNQPDEIVGYSSYRAILVEMSGSLPVTPGGLFAWEIAIIVVAMLLVIAVIIVVVVICMRKKRQSMGYGNLDGHGNTNKHGLNVELPDDDLSISASSPSSRSLTTGAGAVESAEPVVADEPNEGGDE